MSMLPNTALFKRLSSQEDLNNDEVIFEQKDTDAIYNVTIRKVYNQQQQQQQQTDVLSSPNNITNGLVYSKIKIKQMKYGTVEKLIDSFTNQNGELDSSVTNTFLATYRTFTNIKNVLELLFRKYSRIFPASLDMTEEIRVSHLKSFRSIVTTWLDSYSEDFNEPPAFINIRLLDKFCVKYIPESVELIAFIRHKYEAFKNEVQKKNASASVPQLVSSSIYNSKSELNLSNLANSTSKTTASGAAKSHHRSASNSGSITNLDYLDANYRSSANLKHKTHPIDVRTKFKDIDEHYFAEQLTYIDKELFQKVIPHHCLGAIWSSRKKHNNSCNFETINSFIDQFNIITFIVQATVLENSPESTPTPAQRAKIIEKWIRIALYCRNYKNFSSLNAIVQGLDTQCVSRLEKTWNEVSLESRSQFNELIELFSQENNQQLFRETLMRDLEEYKKRFSKTSISPPSISTATTANFINTLDYLEGTAKFADINIGINATLSRKAKERLMKHRLTLCEPLGTVPFLGTFLRDLEYIHAQNPTKTEEGLINFAKKRKEFEIIAQIKLLQRAAQFYRIEPDLNFKSWLKCLPSFSEEVNYDLSYQIEPPRVDREQFLQSVSNSSNSTANTASANVHSPSSNVNTTIRNKKSSLSRSSRCDSLESVNSANNNEATAVSIRHPYQHQFSNNSANTNNRHSRTSSNTSNSDMYLNNSIGSGSTNGISCTPPQQNQSSPLLLVKVNIESPPHNSPSSAISTPSAVYYKKIPIKDSDRTKEVKRMILDKFLMDPNKADKYSLFQVFNDGVSTDIFIKDNCNVYYAVKSVPDIQFILRSKDSTPHEQSSSNDFNNNSNQTNNHNYYSSTSAPTHQTSSSSFTTNLFNLVSPKIQTKKQQANGNNKPYTVGRSSSSAANFRNANSLLPPPSPNHNSNNNNNNSDPDRRASWQIFRNIMS